MKHYALLLCLSALCLVANAAPADSIPQLAARGNAEAQCAMGHRCYDGTGGTKRDYGQALQWWSLAAKQGNVEAISGMALCYRYGHGIARDSVRAQQLYLRSFRLGNKSLLESTEASAKRGDLFDTMLAALAFRSGSGTKRDNVAAMDYFLMAAEGGSADAQREYALASLNAGKADVAAEWFEKAAAAGDLSSTYFIGMLKMKGEGVMQNQVDGLTYLQTAAERGFPQACYDLSQRYAQGDGVEQNDSLAEANLHRAAVLGSHRAQWDVATACRSAGNFYMALAWMAVAENQGYVASFKAAYCDRRHPDNSDFNTYLRGLALLHRRQYGDAIECFDALTANGIVEGSTMKALTLLERYNRQLPDSARTQCVAFLRDAGNIPSAQTLLAYVYTLSEDITDEEADQCVSLLSAAAESGFPQAQSTLGIYYHNLGQEGYGEAVRLFEAAYASGMIDSEAAQVYAAMLRKGEGTVKDDAKAKAVEAAALSPTYKDRLIELYASTWLDE